MEKPGETITEGRTVERRGPYHIGMTADNALIASQILKYVPQKPAAEVGKEKNGLIVEWYLPGITLEFRRRFDKIDRLYCYRITKITLTSPEAEDEQRAG